MLSSLGVCTADTLQCMTAREKGEGGLDRGEGEQQGLSGGFSSRAMRDFLHSITPKAYLSQLVACGTGLMSHSY